MEGIQTLKVSWPWPWPSIRPYGMSSCISHRPLPIYQISFKLKKLFVDGRTYGWTDIFPLYIIRSTLGSRPNKWHQSTEVSDQLKYVHCRGHGLKGYCHGGCSGLVVEYRTRNREVARSTRTQSTASNLEQVANLLCAQANSASYPQWDGKWVVATATGWIASVADWGNGVSASCTVAPIVH